MTFTSPEYFLLIPALALAGWFWRGLRLQSPLRVVILVLAVIALAEPTIQHQQNSLDLYVLLDRSESTEDLIDKGLPEWKRLLEESKPSRHDTLHFINYASEVAVRAGNEAVQIFGGYGYTKEFPVEKFYRDAKLCTIGEGTSEIQKLVISRNILKD